MKKTFLTLTIYALLGSLPIQAAQIDPLTGREEKAKVIVNNRILARINGKVISTYDVMKKMDVLFYRQFPQFTSSAIARYQYYNVNWKSILEELIHKELVLADAAESKIEVSNGDVRQEMENLFGPNIIANLDKVGMTFEEASKIVQGDLMIKRMLGMRVHGKIKQTYEQFTQDPNNARLTVWKYRVVTIRDRTDKKAQATANHVFQMLLEGIAMEQLNDKLKERSLAGRNTKVNVSEEIESNEKELSEAYLATLSQMEKGMYSQPSSYKSRVDSVPVYRIFYVTEKIPGGMPSFKEMEGKLKGQILEDIIDQETGAYLDKLRHHFHVREDDLKALVPEDYQPFSLSR
jgi:hypothetical protein